MEVEVLISCMKQDDFSIAQRTNVGSCTLIVNQHDNNKYSEIELNNGKSFIRMITTTERGLSKSRNTALKHANASICLICDDDEILDDDFEDKILGAFLNIPEADVIAFKLKTNKKKKYPKRKKKINYISALKISSWQIAFKRDKIRNAGIKFDETLGSGVSKAGGEENMFLYNCLKNGLKIYYLPVFIGEMIENESKWFAGFSKEYFFDRGIFTRKLMGKFWAFMYAVYFLVMKYPLYKNDISLFGAMKSLCKGIYMQKAEK